MKKLWIILGGLAVVGILAGVLGYVFIYNKPHTNYEKAKPDTILTAEACFNSFANDSKSLMGQVLLLEGTPTYVDDLDTMVVVVFVFNEDDFGDAGIRCTMLSKYNQEALALNSTTKINIKGRCTGYNGTDVILEHCSLVKQ